MARKRLLRTIIKRLEGFLSCEYTPVDQEAKKKHICSEICHNFDFSIHVLPVPKEISHETSQVASVLFFVKV